MANNYRLIASGLEEQQQPAGEEAEQRHRDRREEREVGQAAAALQRRRCLVQKREQPLDGEAVREQQPSELECGARGERLWTARRVKRGVSDCHSAAVRFRARDCVLLCGERERRPTHGWAAGRGRRSGEPERRGGTAAAPDRPRGESCGGEGGRDMRDLREGSGTTMQERGSEEAKGGRDAIGPTRRARRKR